MAIVRSLGIGSAVKSAGMLTYRHYRGRTIATQRIFENKSDTTLQQLQRRNFAIASFAANQMKFMTSENYERTKYGTRFNAWMKRNYQVFVQSGVANNVEGLMDFALTIENYVAKGSYLKDVTVDGATTSLFIAALIGRTKRPSAKTYARGFSFMSYGSLDSQDLSEPINSAGVEGEFYHRNVSTNMVLQVRPENIKGINIALSAVGVDAFSHRLEEPTKLSQQNRVFAGDLSFASLDFDPNLQEDFILKKKLTGKTSEVEVLRISPANPLGYYTITMDLNGLAINSTGATEAASETTQFYVSARVSEGSKVATLNNYYIGALPDKDNA